MGKKPLFAVFCPFLGGQSGVGVNFCPFGAKIPPHFRIFRKNLRFFRNSSALLDFRPKIGQNWPILGSKLGDFGPKSPNRRFWAILDHVAGVWRWSVRPARKTPEFSPPAQKGRRASAAAAGRITGNPEALTVRRALEYRQGRRRRRRPPSFLALRQKFGRFARRPPDRPAFGRAGRPFGPAKDGVGWTSAAASRLR